MPIKLQDSGLLRQQAYVNGGWIDATNGAQMAVLDPANGNTLASVPDLSATDAEAAIGYAEQALPGWASLTAKARSQALRRWFELILQHQQDLALLLTSEQGKPLAEAAGEIAYGASFVEWFAEEAKRLYGDTIPAPAGDKRVVTIKQPIGVVAAITPWNFPVAMITRKVAPALAAGCTVVIKPAEDTPLSALALAELADRAGIPAGVFNVVTTARPAAVGQQFCDDARVRKLSFTGSTPVGKTLMAQCAGTVKKLSLELGGNAPFIIFDDADLDAAVNGAMASKFRNAGQTCICANRILVQSGIYDQFAERLAAATAKLTLGDGRDDAVSVGPLINQAAVDKVARLVDDAVAKGAKVRQNEQPASSGNFVAPTLLTDVTRDMAIANEEIFGPVAALYRFETEAQAIELANDTPFGLAAYFYARDIGRCWRVAEALEYGMVGINEGAISSEVAPFGGIKESGVGREGSKYGIEEFVEIKTLVMGGI